jgi:hypothetical protein
MGLEKKLQRYNFRLAMSRRSGVNAMGTVWMKPSLW